MSDDLDVDWPTDAEPTSSPNEEEVTPANEAVSGEEASKELDGGEAYESSQSEPLTATSWTLPIRAAPILALQGEEVVEFPLSQHLSGHESTSVIVDEKLMRIVEARYDPDGVRRLNVRMALVKEHISGYSHTHLDMFDKLKFVWWASIGAGLLFATSAFQGLFVLGGGVFVLAGLVGLLMSKLDLHRLSFSDHGGRHDFYLSGWRQEPFLIHNSTALLGPAFVDFLRNGELETQHIDLVIETMGKPAQPAPALAMAPLLPEPEAIPESGPPLALPEPAPPISSEAQPPPPSPAGPPASRPSEPLPPLPPPPATAPAPAPAPLPAPAPPSLPAPPLPVASLPPAPLPPPAPLKANVDEDALWDDLS